MRASVIGRGDRRIISGRVGYQVMTLQVELLETSFDLLAPRGDELVARFYSRLFETAPSTRQLFEHVDMETQKQSLLATLISVREALRDLTTVVPDLEELGERHVGYGARPEHYPVVASVLVETMAELAGPDWRTEYATAWSEALQAVAEVMLRGAARASEGSAPVPAT
jgi:methyl-accepting chemotaxis protein